LYHQTFQFVSSSPIAVIKIDSDADAAGDNVDAVPPLPQQRLYTQQAHDPFSMDDDLVNYKEDNTIASAEDQTHLRSLQQLHLVLDRASSGDGRITRLDPASTSPITSLPFWRT
jgi:hypothetical protein